MATKEIKIFYPYAEKDEALCKQLDTHLAPLRRLGLTSWYDHKILPGTKRTEEIARELRAAHIILLLISSDFLASFQCYDVEMQYALQRQEAGEARVIPIILRPVNWQDTPLKELQALPKKGKPVITWTRKDEAFVDIANGIKSVINEMEKQGPLDDGKFHKKTIRETFVAQAQQSESSVPATNHKSEDTYANKPSGNWKSDLQTDILLITVTTVEAQAVLRLFAEETKTAFQRHYIGDKTYFDLGMINGARIMMVQSEMGAGGPSGAQLVVDEGIRTLSPSAVILVGIAFGVDETLTMGDILVSQQLLGYELQKINNQGEIILRGDRARASTRLLDRFRSGILDWHGPKVECGLILSGDKLIDYQDFRDQLRKMAPEAVGGEMEGTGLYSAAHRRKVDWILVKAISDWADGNKKGQEESIRQQTAAENAVRFTLHVLKQGGFVEDTPRVSPSQPTTNKVSPPPALGTLLRQYDVHASWVIAVAWEPTGNRIASSGADGTVRIWDAETGESLLTYRGHTRLLNAANVQATIYTIAWAPEGLRIVSGAFTNVYVWNATTGQTLTRYQAHSGLLPDIFAVAWSPDGKRIASVCSSIGLDKTIHIWDALTGERLTRYHVRSGLMPNFAVLAIAWSPDGTRLAAACDDKTLRVWNTETERIVSTYRSEWVSDIAWSPDGRYLALAHSDRKAQIWDTFTETKVMVYHEHTEGVRRIAWAPDGKSVATASNDKTVHIWEPLTGKRIYVYRGHTNWATSLAWSPDGTRIASASNDKTVHIWQADVKISVKTSRP